MNTVAYLLLAAGAGIAIGWWLRGRFALDGTRMEAELRDQVRARDAELGALRHELATAGEARASAVVAKEAAEDRALAALREKGEAEAALTVTRDKSSDQAMALATAEAAAAAQATLVASLQETMADQRRVNEQAATAATNELTRATSALDQSRKDLAEATAKLATATAELAAREQSLRETQAALTELRTARAAETTKAEMDLRGLETKLRENGAALATADAQLKAEKNTTTTLKSERDSLSIDRTRGQEEYAALKQRVGELETEKTFLNERIMAERKQVESIQEKFRAEFEAISNKLLVDSSSKFDKQSSESLTKLLEPLRENLTQFRTSLEATRTEAASQNAVLRDTILRIGSEAANLTKALKGDAKVLGNWGENMLDQLLEKSGLQRDVHYRRQSGERDEGGDMKYLDVVVNLPEGRNLVIDSKVSLRAFEEAMNGTDDKERATLIDQHVEATRRHFRTLGDKRYHEIHGINAPDFVLMYIPIEAAYFAALAREPGLFAEAFDRNVVLITNSTLLATLRTVSGVWKLADQQRNALEIADRGGKLYDKFVGFIGDMQAVGKALDSGHQAWEAANNKLYQGPGNLVRQAEMLKSLKVKAAKALPIELIEQAGAEAPPALN
jgi:DNA recombination protein RmuC